MFFSGRFSELILLIVNLMRLLEVYSKLLEILRASEFISDPNLEVERLLTALLNISREQLFLKLRSFELPDEVYLHLLEMAERRASGYPLDYLIGYTYFRNLKLRVKEGVFIPRPETEFLVDLALKVIRDSFHEKQLRVLDVGTGTGCIALAIKKELGDKVEVLALDVSERALRVARDNAISLGLEVRFIEGDVFEIWKKLVRQGRFHLIVSNPPYVSPDWYESHKELWFEPREAFVYKSGPDFYLELSKISHELLIERGVMCLELGFEYQDLVVDAFNERGFEEIDWVEFNGYKVATCLRYIGELKTSRG